MYSKNAWEKYNEQELKEVMSFNEGYKDFISKGKTERECVKLAVSLAKEKGFKDLNECKSLKAGDKVYATNKGKNFASFVIGKKKVEDGLRVLGAHIDSPRLDIKQNPLYESTSFALLDTHYYGGVKKYQWVTIPLALYGVVVKKNGEFHRVVLSLPLKKDNALWGVVDYSKPLEGTDKETLEELSF